MGSFKLNLAAVLVLGGLAAGAVATAAYAASQQQFGTAIDAFGSGPSIFTGGAYSEDPRVPATGVTAGGATGLLFTGPVYVLDAAPSTPATNNLVTAAVGPPTGLTLTAGTGVTLSGGNYYIDGIPNATNPSSDITKLISRSIKISDSGSSDGAVTFAVVGLDIYGNVIHQTMTGVTSSAPQTSTKTFKAITSITPSTTTAGNVSVGFVETYGFPLRADNFGETVVSWNGIIADAATGFSAANASTASATTGDVRGTYATQTTSANGNVQLVIQQLPKSWTNTTTLFGVPQF